VEAEAALRQAARAAPLTRAGIAELADRLRAGADDLSEVLEDADGDAAVALMLAGALVGQPPSADQVARFIAPMSHMAALPILVGCAAGDRVGMLVDVAASGRLSHERASLALFLAVELLGDAPPPPGLLTQLRLHAREPLSSEAGVTLGMAASGVSDPGVRAVAAEWIELASLCGGERLQTEMRRLLAGPLTAVLPEREPPRVVSGYTVRRAVRERCLLGARRHPPPPSVSAGPPQRASGGHRLHPAP